MKKQSTMLLLFLLVPAFALTACISLPFGNKDRAPSSIYTLHASQSSKAEARASNRRGATVVVPKPELPAGFDTERIALFLDQGRRLDYYADAKWSARLDDLLQDFLIQKAQQDLPGKVVGSPDLAAAKYKLALKVDDFEPVYMDAPDKAPRLDVAMTVTVVTLPGETVKTQFSVKKSVPASGNTLTTITNELGDLLHSVTDEALQKAAPFLG